MVRKGLLVGLVYNLLFYNCVFSQNPNIHRVNYWILGNSSLNYSGSFPLCFPNFTMFGGRGSSTMSSINGDLLLYSDGVNVWNNQDILINPNNPLLGDLNSTTSVITIPNLINPDWIHLITVGQGKGDVYQHLTDLSLNNGNGAMVYTNSLIAENSSEKLAAIESCERSKYWTYGFYADDGTFFSVELSGSQSNLVNYTPVCSINQISLISGYMKFSPNGNFLAVSGYGNTQTKGTGIFLFNDYTGEIYLSNEINYSYQTEFSSKSNLLFLGIRNDLPMLSMKLDSSLIFNQLIDSVSFGFGELVQLDKNSNIISRGINALSETEILSNNFTFNLNSVTCNPQFNLTGHNFPTFPSSYFYPEKYRVCYSGTCPQDEYFFFISGEVELDSVRWNFGDYNSSNNAAWGESVSHIYENPGIYLVKAFIHNNNSIDTILKYIFVKDFVENQGVFVDTIVCEFNEDLGFQLPIPEHHAVGCPIYGEGVERGGIVRKPGNYTITWNYSCGESITDVFNVYPCDTYEFPIISNIITPNSDGINDDLLFDMKNLKELKVYIYNRWGRIVSESSFTHNDINSKIITIWDGNCNKVKCSDGVYYYILDAVSISEKSYRTSGFISVFSK